MLKLFLMMNILRIISRIFVGIVFIFSGFVKAIDPLGSTYKFVDYFNAFGLGSFEHFALPLAILLSSLELALGILLLAGYRMKLASWILLLFMSFFTVLTFILALTNPVHDCGCFGDALILTNWQTFWKNIILMVFTILIFASRDKFTVRRNPVSEYIVIGMYFMAVVLLSVYCLSNLPIIDFRPYKTGTYIPEAMAIPADAPQSVYETTLIYRNKTSGKEEEFTMENFPRDNEKWEFVDAESVLVSAGYEPPIHDFNVYAPDGSELTDLILSNKEYSLLYVSYDLDKANRQSLKHANKYFHLSLAYPDLEFYALTASVSEKIDSARVQLGLDYDFCQVDEITLKTMIRANPGLMLIHDGTIIFKSHADNLPLISANEPFQKLLKDFPFCKDCDLREINKPPIWSKQEVFETVLLYRNLISNTLSEFTIDNFPRDNAEWIFEDSRSVMISEGFKGPLSGFNPISIYGQDVGENIIENPAYSLLFFIRDINSLPDETMQKLVKLGGMAGESIDDNLEVYALVPEIGEDLLSLSDNYISTYDYYSLPADIFDLMSKENLSVVLLHDGKVIFNLDEANVPSPEGMAELITPVENLDAGNVFEPLVISTLRNTGESRLIFLLASLFLLSLTILGLYFNRKKPN